MDNYLGILTGGGDCPGLNAVIRAVGDNYEIENKCAERPVCINGHPVQQTRLRHGDQIAIGRTVFVFQKRRG